MKKSTLFLIFIASIVYACAPQVTVTPTPLSTETPVPTPTVHPQLAALQEKIAASGGRFTLSSQGTIEDNGVPIPGLTVAPDGTMTLTVNGKTVTLDPTDVSFDKEKGISIKGYELDENGAWVLTPELVAKMEWQEKLGSGFEVRADGSVWDKTSGMQLPGVNWKKGTWTYEFDGNPNFTVPITADDLNVRKDANGKPTGVLSFVHLGWLWDGEKLVRKEFQGEPVYSLLEVNTRLANPKMVDLTHRDLDTKFDPLIFTYKKPGASSPRIVIRGLDVSINRYALAENIVIFPDGQGRWKVIETTTYLMREVATDPYTIMSYRDHDKVIEIMVVDRDDIVPEKGPGDNEWKHPTGLSEYYKDHTVNLQY